MAGIILAVDRTAEWRQDMVVGVCGRPNYCNWPYHPTTFLFECDLC